MNWTDKIENLLFGIAIGGGALVLGYLKYYFIPKRWPLMGEPENPPTEVAPTATSATATPVQDE